LLRRLRTLISDGYAIRVESIGSAEDHKVRFVKLRQDFERARMLVDLVRKRELAKRQLLDSLHSLVMYHASRNGIIDESDEDKGADKEMEDVEEDDAAGEEEQRDKKEKMNIHHYPKRLRH